MTKSITKQERIDALRRIGQGAIQKAEKTQRDESENQYKLRIENPNGNRGLIAWYASAGLDESLLHQNVNIPNASGGVSQIKTFIFTDQLYEVVGSRGLVRYLSYNNDTKFSGIQKTFHGLPALWCNIKNDIYCLFVKTTNEEFEQIICGLNLIELICFIAAGGGNGPQLIRQLGANFYLGDFPHPMPVGVELVNVPNIIYTLGTNEHRGNLKKIQII